MCSGENPPERHARRSERKRAASAPAKAAAGIHAPPREIPSEAPSAAPEAMPSVYGSASGFTRIPWSTTPDTASEAPAPSDARSRGSRTACMTSACCGVRTPSNPRTALSAPERGIAMSPESRRHRAAPPRRRSSPGKTQYVRERSPERRILNSRSSGAALPDKSGEPSAALRSHLSSRASRMWPIKSSASPSPSPSPFKRGSTAYPSLESTLTQDSGSSVSAISFFA